MRELMEDRIDDMLEPLARRLGGKTQWEEMKENAMLDTARARSSMPRWCNCWQVGDG
jgi:hypothetical protein